MAKQLARAAFVWTGTAGHLLWPSLMQTMSAQVVLARPTHRFPFFEGLSADVIQSPDMTTPEVVFFKDQMEKGFLPSHFLLLTFLKFVREII